MKATQLEQLSIDYAFAIEKFNACKSSLEHTKNVFISKPILIMTCSAYSQFVRVSDFVKSD
jgi:hypothetical protein